jgi:hypothetical protein
LLSGLPEIFLLSDMVVSLVFLPDPFERGFPLPYGP